VRYSRVIIQSIGYELPATVVTSEELEQRLAPLYRSMRLQVGQLAALTGIRERRYWPMKHTMADGAIKAGRKALAASGITPDQIGMVIYGGVCRDNLEPATACAVADGLAIRGAAQVYDVSNACLGVINGMVHVANAIELGHIKAGLVVSCESARQIVDLSKQRMLAEPDMERFRLSLATLTGGSGAIAVLICHESMAKQGHRLLGGAIHSQPRYHQLCRWGPDTGMPASAPMQMDTDAAAVMEHGVELGLETWQDFLREMKWSPQDVDRTICHQVGAPHRDTVLKAIGVSPERDFQTYEYLGNIGTVSLPITAAIAEERGMLEAGHRVGFLGIGSGLNCLMLGVEW
jgi:3-oxoacyl-[acyl-carrier-protein] synthase III